MVSRVNGCVSRGNPVYRLELAGTESRPPRPRVQDNALQMDEVFPVNTLIDRLKQAALAVAPNERTVVFGCESIPLKSDVIYYNSHR